MRFSFRSAHRCVRVGAAAATTGRAPKPLPMPSLTPKLHAAMPTPSMVAPDAVVFTVGDDKITKAQFDMILATLPPQQQAQAQTPKGRPRYRGEAGGDSDAGAGSQGAEAGSDTESPDADHVVDRSTAGQCDVSRPGGEHQAGRRHAARVTTMRTKRSGRK